MKIYNKLKEICNGWGNLLFPRRDLKKFIKETGDYRLEICNKCKYNSKNCKTWSLFTYCTICKCPLKAKTKCLICECPDSPARWKAIFYDLEMEEENEKERKIQT